MTENVDQEDIDNIQRQIDDKRMFMLKNKMKKQWNELVRKYEGRFAADCDSYTKLLNVANELLSASVSNGTFPRSTTLSNVTISVKEGVVFPLTKQSFLLTICARVDGMRHPDNSKDLDFMMRYIDSKGNCTSRPSQYPSKKSIALTSVEDVSAYADLLDAKPLKLSACPMVFDEKMVDAAVLQQSSCITTHPAVLRLKHYTGDAYKASVANTTIMHNNTELADTIYNTIDAHQLHKKFMPMLKDPLYVKNARARSDERRAAEASSSSASSAASSNLSSLGLAGMMQVISSVYSPDEATRKKGITNLNKCSRKDCDRFEFAYTLCNEHYRQAHNIPTPPRRAREKAASGMGSFESMSTSELPDAYTSSRKK